MSQSLARNEQALTGAVNPDFEGFPTAASAQFCSNLKEMLHVNLAFLIGDSQVPCAIFLYLDKKFFEVLKTDEMLSIGQLERLKNRFHYQGFIAHQDAIGWNTFCAQRHLQVEPLVIFSSEQKKDPRNLTSHRLKAKSQAYWMYALDKVQYQTPDDQQQLRINHAQTVLKRAASNRMIDWFFLQPPEEVLIHHSARVTYLVLLFSSIALPPIPGDALDFLTLASMIHELIGAPDKESGHITSIVTLEHLKEKKYAVPNRVMDLIAQFDELYSGAGVPKKLKGNQISVLARIFSIVNRFDHLRLMHSGGTRRVRHERAVALMEKSQSDYDPVLIKHFFKFIQKVEIFE